MGLFIDGKKEEKEAWEKYADKYIEGVERIHAIGGFPLVVFATGIVIIGIAIAIGVFASSNVSVPLIASGGLIAVSGIAIHILEVRHKKNAYQKSLDNLNSMTHDLWQIYLENMKKREVIDSTQMNRSIEDLNKILNSRESKD